MTEADAVKAIYQRWMTLWPGLSALPYAFDDDAIDEPPAGYARVSIALTGDDQHTLGAPGNQKYLRTGSIDVKFYAQANKGRGGADALAGLVRTIYEGKRFGATGTEDGVVCFASSGKELRAKSDGQWWLLLVSTPFEFFEVR